MAAQLQEQAEKKAGQVATHCVNCRGLLRKSPREAGYEWQHVFREDRRWCESPLPDMKGNNDA